MQPILITIVYKISGIVRPMYKNALTEGRAYVIGGTNDGCEVSPSCLICPRPLCKFDDPDYVSPKQKLKHIAREKAIVKLTKQGMSAVDISNKMGRGFSERTIQRIRISLNIDHPLKTTCKRGHTRIAGVKKCNPCQKVYYERNKKVKR